MEISFKISRIASKETLVIRTIKEAEQICLGASHAGELDRIKQLNKQANKYEK